MNRIYTLQTNSWQENFSGDTQTHAVTALENGQLLFFPQLQFSLFAHEKNFLRPEIVSSKTKNISYDITTDTLRGAQLTPDESQQLKKMLRRFAQQAQALVVTLFPQYKNALQQARTSFRPVAIAGRVSSYRKDDKRLHIDAFPATPNQGKRILRVFSNIHPAGEDRIWRIGEPFARVAEKFLPQVSAPLPGSARILKWLRLTKTYRTHYDHIMLQIHDAMKKDLHYQKYAEQITLHLPAETSWIVQTDHVSHAAMSGQHALEQTFHLPVDAMQNPHLSPLRALEKMLGRELV